MPPNRPLSIFISYTRADAGYARSLWNHLADFRGRDDASVFFDQLRLEAGERWRDEIDQALAGTNVFVLLLSAEFLNSSFCIETEVRVALERLVARRSRIFVVQVGACIYDRVPPNAPGGRYLGEVARQTAKALADLQAAGPFNDSGRLVPLNSLSAPVQDMAWQQIIDRIYDHFGLERIRLADSERDPRSLPDATTLVAQCDRTALVEQISRLAGKPEPAVLAVTGHRLERWLFRRITQDLEASKPPTSTAPVYFHRASNCGAAADFDRYLLSHAATGLDPPPRTARQVIAWVASDQRQLLLVGHAISGTSARGRLHSAKQALQAASAWASLHRRALLDQQLDVQIVVLIGIECPLGSDAGWLGRLRSWLLGDVERKVGAHVKALGAGAVGEDHPMRDYLADDIKEWLQQPEVQAAFSRDGVLHGRLLDELERRARWHPRQLLKVCLELGVPMKSQPDARTTP